MKTIRVTARGDSVTELEADALRQGHVFFGPEVPLRVLPDWEAEESGAGQRARWRAHVRVTPEREPLGQSEVAEAVRRQVQWAWKYAREAYGKARP